MTPDEHTIQELMLDVGDGHQLYVQEWGNKEATVPIVFLHGGPGGSVQDKHKQPHDPTRQRVIFFDQRGCGKSLPYGSLEHNTTQDLIEDIEKIAQRLNLEKFVLTGGSWGSCLAFAYALKYPNRIKAMVLRGIFTGSSEEAAWVDQGKFASHFPDVWDTYLSQTPAENRDDPSAYHFGRALGDNPQAAKASAYAYANLEGALLSLDDRYTPESFDTYDPSGIRIEIHYLANHCFLPDDYILDHAYELTMPVWLVQGRYDMVGPPFTAYGLSKALPDNHLIWTTSGHRDERESWNVLRTILLQLTEED